MIKIRPYDLTRFSVLLREHLIVTGNMWCTSQSAKTHSLSAVLETLPYPVVSRNTCNKFNTFVLIELALAVTIGEKDI